MARRAAVRRRRLALAVVAGAAGTALVVAAGLPPDATVPADAPPLARYLGWPTVTPSLAPRLPPRPTIVAAAAPSRPLLPREPRRLLDGGCCVGAWWAEDSSGLRYLDRPGGALTAALYRISVWPPGSAAHVLTSDDLAATLSDPVVIRHSRGYALVEDVTTGDKWPLPTGGKPVRISPDGSWAVWWDTPGQRVFHDTIVRLYASDVYGFDERVVGGMYGAEVVGFAAGGQRVLAVGRRDRLSAVRDLVAIDLRDNTTTTLASGNRLADALVSPDGSRVVYSVSLDHADPEANGVWVVGVDAEPARKLPFDGSYRWRDGRRLLCFPLQPHATAHVLWQVDTATMTAVELLGTDVPWLRVANNDWSVSPDGDTLAFLSELDRNLWVVDLPE